MEPEPIFIELEEEDRNHPIQINLDDPINLNPNPNNPNLNNPNNNQHYTQNPLLRPSSLLEKYLSQKKAPIFQLPNSTHQTMNGQFYYPPGGDDSKHSTTSFPQEGYWWASEKLDGIRAIWTGEQLITRRGKVLNPPEQFIKNFPSQIALDGELYLKPQSFSDTQSIVMDITSPDPEEWRKLTYQVWDVPDSYLLTFEEVQLLLKKYLPPAKTSPIRLVYQQQISSHQELETLQRNILRHGGEGIMLRKPFSKYQFARTNDLLKWKARLNPKTQQLDPSMDDYAIIIGYNLDYGAPLPNNPQKYRLRSLQLAWNHKNKRHIEFSLSGGITQSEKRSDFSKRFPIGKVVKVLFQDISEFEKPRFPRLSPENTFP